jgi:hypothetical protein
MSAHSDLADGLLPSERPTQVSPPLRDFKPWHKVRKEFVRRRQWNRLIAALVERYLKAQLQEEHADWSIDADSSEVASADDIPESVRIDRPLRCLVIPGDDLLDIRSLWTDLRPQGCYIRYLGFNEAHGSEQSGTRLHISNNEVTSLGGVTHDSQVLRDRFQAIALRESQAYHVMRQYGPYHVVNLDLCDSLFPTGSGRWDTYLSALHQLAGYQMKHQTVPWLLFITSQIEAAAASKTDLEKLCEPIGSNCNSYAEFGAHFGSLFRSSPCSTSGVVDVTDLNEDEMLRLFGVALGKWLMALAGSAAPSWIVQLLRSHRYRIRDNPRVEMLSLAFQFRPMHVPPVDPTGLSAAQLTVPSFPSELDCATRLVTAVEHITDVDQILADDGLLRDAILNSSADLLESAGYDREAYLAWVTAGERT